MMDPYAAATQSRIRLRDIASAVDAGPFIAGSSLAALERRRRWQAETEVAWVLQHGIPPASAASWVAMARQAIGAALVRVGECLATAPPRGNSPAAALPDGTLCPTS